MLEIRKILQNKQRGVSDRRAARAVGISRTTLVGYLHRLRASDLDFGELMTRNSGNWPGPKQGIAVQMLIPVCLPCLHTLKRHFPT